MLQKYSLLSSSNDEDSTEDEALPQNVSNEAVLKGPQAVQPHADAQERQETHLPLTGPIEMPLQGTQTNHNLSMKSFMQTETDFPQILNDFSCVCDAGELDESGLMCSFLLKRKTSTSGAKLTTQYTDSLQKRTANLLIQEDLPLEIRSEVLDLGADVLLHHSVQRDPELIQLGFQRGQLCSLLQPARTSNSQMDKNSHLCLINLQF